MLKIKSFCPEGSKFAIYRQAVEFSTVKCLNQILHYLKKRSREKDAVFCTYNCMESIQWSDLRGHTQQAYLIVQDLQSNEK